MRTFACGAWRITVTRVRRAVATRDVPDLARLMLAGRLRRGWSQEDLAREVGYSVRTVRRWEEGAQPRPRGVIALARALDLDVTPNEREAA